MGATCSQGFPTGEPGVSPKSIPCAASGCEEEGWERCDAIVFGFPINLNFCPDDAKLWKELLEAQEDEG